jgi:hypothetical protein
VAGYAAQALLPSAVVEQIKADVRVPATQKPLYVQMGFGDDLHFLPNPRYRPSLDDVDMDSQQRLLELREAELTSRFVPAMTDFFGRAIVLTELAAWLSTVDSHDNRARVVTGDPGSGKTAVLGLLATLADPQRRGSVNLAGLPAHLRQRLSAAVSTIDVSIYAGGLPTESVLDAISGVVGLRLATDAGISSAISDLIQVIRRRDVPLTVLVDALDEAAEPRQAATWVLKPLIERCGTALRVLIGTRNHLVADLSRNIVVLDLDDDRYADPAAVYSLARRNLLHSNASSPYRAAQPRLVDAVAEAIADAAGHSFLVARIASQTQAAAADAADPADRQWLRQLPRSAGPAMRNDLQARLGNYGAAKAATMLLPLAYAQDPGLPWEQLWAALATASPLRIRSPTTTSSGFASMPAATSARRQLKGIQCTGCSTKPSATTSCTDDISRTTKLSLPTSSSTWYPASGTTGATGPPPTPISAPILRAMPQRAGSSTHFSQIRNTSSRPTRSGSALPCRPRGPPQDYATLLPTNAPPDICSTSPLWTTPATSNSPHIATATWTLRPESASDSCHDHGLFDGHPGNNPSHRCRSPPATPGLSDKRCNS